MGTAVGTFTSWQGMGAAALPMGPFAAASAGVSAGSTQQFSASAFVQPGMSVAPYVNEGPAMRPFTAVPLGYFRLSASPDAPAAPPPPSPPSSGGGAAAPPGSPPASGVPPPSGDGGPPRGTKENPVEIVNPDGTDWEIPRPVTQEFVDKLVKAIVAQDSDVFPGGSVEGFSARLRYTNRVYRIGEKAITLNSILRWVRSARGLGSNDCASLPMGQIISDLKSRLFGVEPEKPPERHAIPIAGDFGLPIDPRGRIDVSRLTAEQIDDVVKAIVSQDHDVYPNSSAKNMSTSEKYLRRRYAIGGQAITLDMLLGWVRVIRGCRSGDYRAIPNKQIVDGWKERLFRIEVDRPAEHAAVPIAIGFELPVDSRGRVDAKRITTDQIEEIVRAIVSQDHEFYPAGSAEHLTTANRCFLRWYLVGSHKIQFSRVISWWRVARGLKTNSFEDLPNKAIVGDWKSRLFGIEPEKPPECIAIPIAGEFELPMDPRGRIDTKRLTAAQIDEIVKAIVAQDQAFYPDGSARNMTTRRECLGRRYKIGGFEVSLDRLGSWIRIIKGLRSADSKAMPKASVADDWKRRLFGIEKTAPVQHQVVPIIIDFELPMGPHGRIDVGRLTVAQIDDIVRAIVVQDHEFYPDGTARNMSTHSRCTERRYKFGNIEVNVGIIIRWSSRKSQVATTEAGGIATGLSGSEVVRDWKSRLFGIDVTSVEHDVIPIDVGFELPEPGKLTSTQIDTIVRALVSQDQGFYPGGSAANMSTAQKCQNRRYRIGERVLRFGAVVGWARQARGLIASDTRTLSDKSTVEDWKMRLFGIETRDAEHESTPITIDFELPLSARGDVDSKKLTLDQTDAIVRSIVEQDGEFYPDGTVQGRLSTAKRCFERRYKIGDREITLLTVARWVRVIKGYAIGDTRSLSQKKIVDDWKRRLFGIDARPMTAEEFSGWVESQGLADVVRVLENSPNALEDFVRALNPGMSDHEIVRMMRAFAELRLGSGWRPDGREGGDGGGGVDPLIQAILMRREMLEGMSVEQRARLVRAMKAHWEKSFNRDPEGTISALGSLCSRVTDPRVQEIISEVMRLFRETSDFAVAALRTELMPFQREGAMFLAPRDAAILADEPGLGKTIEAIAAAEHLRETGRLATSEGGKKILVIAPASVKRPWAAQLSSDPSVGHLAEGRKVVVIEGNRDMRRRLALAASDADYVVVNYEYLVDAPEDEIAAITGGLAIKIVDEAQMVQNPSEKILRANAVRKIRAPRTWYLTATPYFANVENIWTHLNDLEPGRHGTLAAFRAAHSRDEVGLVTLHRRMQGLMLRRRKADVLGTYDPSRPPDAQPLMLPQMRWVDPGEEGSYRMSAEQQEASLLLLTDFEGFWDIYGTNNGREASDVGPMERLEMLFKIIHEPEAFGLNGRESKDVVLDDIVRRRMAAGQKIVLYANRRGEAARLAARYREFESVLFWGGMSEAKKEAARESFQDGDARIIVGTDAMMLGIDLTAADCLVFTQMPWTYPQVYQLKDRLQRLDPHHRKASVDIVRLVGRYQGLEGASPTEEFYIHEGSYDELLARHLESGQQVYDIVMDLPYLEDRLDRLVKASLGKSIFGDLKGRQRKAMEAGQTFYPLYVAARSFDASEQERAQSAVIAIAELYADHAEAAGCLVAMYRKYLEGQGTDEDSSATLPVEEMELVATLSQVRNKYLRGIVLEDLPRILEGIHSGGRTLDEAISHEGEMRPIHLLGWLIAGGDSGGSAADAVSNKIGAVDQFSELERREDIQHRLEQGMLRLMPERLRIANFLERHADAISGAGVEDVTELLERLGTAMAGSRELFEMFIEEDFGSVDEMIDQLRDFELDIYFDNLGAARTDENRMRLRALIPEGLDGFLMLARRYGDSGLAAEGAQLREIFGHVVAGDFDGWRALNTAISYRSDDEEFWQGFNAGIRTRPTIDSGSVDVGGEIAESYDELMDNLRSRASDGGPQAIPLEHKIVWEWIGRYLAMNADERPNYLNAARSAHQAMERIEARLGVGVPIDQQDIARLGAFGLARDLGDVRDASYRKKVATHLHNLVVWIEGLEAARLGIEGRDRKAVDRALATLSNISRRYQARLAGAKDSVATPLSQLVHLLRHRSWRPAGRRIVIEDTADWRMLLNIGRLYPELINCLVPDGDVNFTRTLVDLLASRNKRLVIARDEESGEVLSVGVVKVRRAEDGRTVLHLERPFGRKGSKFEGQMLEHIRIKRQKMGPAGRNALMTRQARTAAARDAGVKLWTTGSAAGQFEHVEDFFNVAPVDSVAHRAEEVD